MKTSIERSLYHSLISEGVSEAEATEAVRLANASRGEFVTTEHTHVRISVGGGGCDAEITRH